MIFVTWVKEIAVGCGGGLIFVISVDEAEAGDCGSALMFVI